MEYRKNGAIQEEKSRHGAGVMPIGRVENVDAQQHHPDHGGFIALLLNMLQSAMEEDAANTKHDPSKVECSKSSLKPLAQGVHETNQGKQDDRGIRYRVEEFCNILRDSIIFFTPLGTGCNRTPVAI
eukprot:TRINITY_DN3426_c0_g2_i1.p2 TRINITY_DN3426_c0_g2~~TRINITY_DN3426_c0_g2_i1.p2  ORF type:complete len:127 (-),score=22.19 TRINITY_DN3426_c0_g2_i1:42-422(-)